MQQILIVDSDKSFADRLAEALRRVGDYQVRQATTMRGACLQLASRTAALAFIPLADDGLLDALRALQSDLRLVVTPPTSDFHLPAAQRGRVQGVLIRSLLAADLTAVLDDAFRQPFPTDEPPDAPPPLDVEAALEIVGQPRPGEALQAAIVGQDGRLLAHSGSLNERQATAVILLARTAPNSAEAGTRLQFVRFPGESDRLIYHHPVAGDVHLTLVAAPDAGIGWLRRRAADLAMQLATLVGDPDHPNGRSPIPAPSPEAMTVQPPPELTRRTFSLLWRPVAPLPPALVRPVTRLLTRLAATEDCRLLDLTVATDHVAVTLTCPPGRRAGWAAHLLKSRSEQAIQRQFGVTAVLWQPGHYATESAVPLSDAERRLLLA